MFRLPLALTVAIAAPMLISAAPVEADLVLVQQHLQSVTSMTATFAQTDRNGRTLTGTMTLKRPGKIRFQYQKGVPLLVVGDGKALTMIDYSVKQVSRWPIGNSSLSVLLNPNLDLARVATVVRTDAQVLAIQARDPKKPEFGTISIVFARRPGAPAGMMLEGWSTLDAQNNRTAVRLTNQHFNVAVADSNFRWLDPRRSGPRG